MEIFVSKCVLLRLCEMVDLENLSVGKILPELVRGPVSRSTLALFAGGSHDHVLLHIDSDFAKAAGMDDVFGHGMLSMAYLAQAIKSWVPQDRLRRWSVRFTAITPLNAEVYCRGTVIEVLEENGERLAKLKIETWTDKKVQTLDGEAFVAV